MLPPRCEHFLLTLIFAVIAACGEGGSSDDRTRTLATASATATPSATTTPLAPMPTATAAEVVAWAAGGNQLLRSDDGGEHWTLVENAGGNRLAFVDRDTGWVIGRGIFVLHTADGGRHWTDQTVNIAGVIPVLTNVAALDAAHAVIVGGENPVAGPDPSRHGPPVALVTSDAGMTWRRAQLDGVDISLFQEVRLLSTCLTRGGVGLATGTNLTNFAQTIVLLTHDAGNTWENITSRLPSRPLGRVACTPGERLWFFGGESTVLRSSDGGRTWEDRRSDLRPSLVLHGLTFFDASVGWAVAEDPFGSPSMPGGPGHRIVLLDTEDGAAHWRERLVSSDHGELTLGINFFDRRRGVIVAQDLHPFAFPRSSFGLSFVTTDGGDTWTETVHPEPIDALWDVELFP